MDHHNRNPKSSSESSSHFKLNPPIILSIVLLIILLGAGSFLFFGGRKLQSEERKVSVGGEQMKVYKATFWIIEQIEIKWGGNDSVLVCILTEENYEKQTSGNTPVYIINFYSNFERDRFTPDIGEIYYLEIGNPGLTDVETTILFPVGFEYQGKIGMPDTNLF